ncbi:hypothetical protein SDC9_168176 [bioreactor metagenome]|uniref:Uncharacterized protein n=1 Tax=bioreactor metagenome TaxID=1076179 RepID=A0A645G1T5_9ZZZZ
MGAWDGGLARKFENGSRHFAVNLRQDMNAFLHGLCLIGHNRDLLEGHGVLLIAAARKAV